MIKKKERCIDKDNIFFPVLEIPMRLDINHPSLIGKEAILNQLSNNLSMKEGKGYLKGKLGKALVRVDKGEILTTVSNNYHMLTHEKFIETAESTMRLNGIEFELFDINIGGKNQNRVFCNYILPSYKFDVEGDVFIPFIQAYNCYDKFLSYGLLTGMYREETESAFLVFNKNILASRRHSRGKVGLTEDMIDVGNWISKLGELRRRIYELKEKNITEYDSFLLIGNVLKAMMHRNLFIKHKLLKREEERYGKTCYSLFLSLLYYSTHGLYNTSRIRPYDMSRHSQIKIHDVFL